MADRRQRHPWKTVYEPVEYMWSIWVHFHWCGTCCEAVMLVAGCRALQSVKWRALVGLQQKVSRVSFVVQQILTDFRSSVTGTLSSKVVIKCSLKISSHYKQKLRHTNLWSITVRSILSENYTVSQKKREKYRTCAHHQVSTNFQKLFRWHTQHEIGNKVVFKDPTRSNPSLHSLLWNISIHKSHRPKVSKREPGHFVP